MTSFEMNAEGQACLRALIIHDRAADRRHPDGQDYTCAEMEVLLGWLKKHAPDFAETLPAWCFSYD
jgi:hypothetical protein